MTISGWTQDTIIQDIEIMTPQADAEIVARYRSDLVYMAKAARETGTRVLLMMVASNWKWHGREDLAAGRLDELLGELGGLAPER